MSNYSTCAGPMAENKEGKIVEEKELETSADDYDNLFNPVDYLNHFYSEEAIRSEGGMRLSLFALPIFARMIRDSGRLQSDSSLLDVGAGPTIYAAICFRQVVSKITLSDYAQTNLVTLRQWLNGQNDFDWMPVMRMICQSEGVMPLPNQQTLAVVEEQTRQAVRNGSIERCDVHNAQVLIDRANGPAEKFDIVVSIFCLESACTDLKAYQNAMDNIVGLIRSGGRLIIGSVIEDTFYQFGKEECSSRFRLLHLTQEQIEDAMQKAGIVTKLRQHTLQEEGVVIIMGEKG